MAPGFLSRNRKGSASPPAGDAHLVRSPVDPSTYPEWSSPSMLRKSPKARSGSLEERGIKGGKISLRNPFSPTQSSTTTIPTLPSETFPGPRRGSAKLEKLTKVAERRRSSMGSTPSGNSSSLLSGFRRSSLTGPTLGFRRGSGGKGGRRSSTENSPDLSATKKKMQDRERRLSAFKPVPTLPPMTPVLEGLGIDVEAQMKSTYTPPKTPPSSHAALGSSAHQGSSATFHTAPNSRPSSMVSRRSRASGRVPPPLNLDNASSTSLSSASTATVEAPSNRPISSIYTFTNPPPNRPMSSLNPANRPTSSATLEIRATSPVPPPLPSKNDDFDEEPVSPPPVAPVVTKRTSGSSMTGSGISAAPSSRVTAAPVAASVRRVESVPVIPPFPPPALAPPRSRPPGRTQNKLLRESIISNATSRSAGSRKSGVSSKRSTMMDPDLARMSAHKPLPDMFVMRPTQTMATQTPANWDDVDALHWENTPEQAYDSFPPQPFTPAAYVPETPAQGYFGQHSRNYVPPSPSIYSVYSAYPHAPADPYHAGRFGSVDYSSGFGPDRRPSYAPTELYTPSIESSQEGYEEMSEPATPTVLVATRQPAPSGESTTAQAIRVPTPPEPVFVPTPVAPTVSIDEADFTPAASYETPTFASSFESTARHSNVPSTSNDFNFNRPKSRVFTPAPTRPDTPPTPSSPTPAPQSRRQSQHGEIPRPDTPPEDVPKPKTPPPANAPPTFNFLAPPADDDHDYERPIPRITRRQSQPEKAIARAHAEMTRAEKGRSFFLVQALEKKPEARIKSHYYDSEAEEEESDGEDSVYGGEGEA
ncbi:hypothetical protein MNV49_000189 [Pseudohyphozyma bogoriensis]|nr:hypothetical protein MNV49_000189 [Pseudohyphozyma bogoriensis]